MNSDTITMGGSQLPLPDSVAAATSELNNLLQIISGTSSLIEETCHSNESSRSYLNTLRSSIQRAEKVAADLADRAGGAKEKTLMNPALAPFAKTKGVSNGVKKSESILLVDDEQMTLTLVSRILSEAGFQITTAQSGFECLDLFRQRPYDFHLILLDLTMPLMDGEETFHRLREIRPDIPVVLCTGFIQQERLQQLISTGLAGFLRKPLAPDEIVGHVQATLAGVKYSRHGVDPNSVPAVL